MIQPDHLLLLQFVEDVQLSHDARQLAWVVTTLEPDAARPRIHVRGQGAFTDGSAPRFSPDGRWLAFLRGGHLHVSPADRPRVRLLADVEAHAPCWSPDGTRLVFPSPAPPHSEHEPRVAKRRWQKADGVGLLRPTRLCVADLDGNVTRLTGGHDITPAWSPDGRRIAFARIRDEGHSLSDLWTCAADGTDIHRLTHDVTRARCPSWSADGRWLAFYGVDSDARYFGDPMLGLWLVPADGSAAPRRVDLGGRAVGYIPPQYVESGPLWEGGRLLVPVTDRGAVHLLSVDVMSGEVKTLFDGAGHVIACSAAAGHLAWVRGDARDPGDVWLDGERVTDVNAGYREVLPEVRQRTFATPNGEVDGWLYGGTRGGPLLIDVHGGPHSFTGHAFSFGHFYRYVMGTRGWNVLALNPTGSGSYGQAFVDGIRGAWGERDLPEHLAAIDALIAEGEVDGDRLAVTGYSYGGYMTCWALTQTDRFKVGVSGGAVTNLESFWGTSDIGPWFGPYEMGGELRDVRETYRRLSPVQYADRVRAPLLMLHGERDDRCPIGQSEEFFNAVAALDRVACELVRYPGATHLLPYRGRPSFRIDYCQRLIDWIERWIDA